VTVETVAEPSRPDRFWAMMEQIWGDLKARGHVPRSALEIEAERQAFREEWDERQQGLEQIHLEGERLRQQASQAKEQPQ
jgi:hypothetical protein